MGAKYDIELEVTSQPKALYQTDKYFDLDLPLAPAIMVDDEVVVEGSDIAEEKLEASIRRHLGLPELPRKGFMSRLLGA
ncbi:MAG: hypothetical protein Q7J24_11995 [Desulfomicrobium sp.]|nr:hypothetical protein [Desulfomicrobium sp.]